MATSKKKADATRGPTLTKAQAVRFKKDASKAVKDVERIALNARARGIELRHASGARTSLLALLDELGNHAPSRR